MKNYLSRKEYLQNKYFFDAIFAMIIYNTQLVYSEYIDKMSKYLFSC